MKKKQIQELKNISKPFNIVLCEIGKKFNESVPDLKKIRLNYRKAGNLFLKLCLKQREFGLQNWHVDYSLAIGSFIKGRDFRKAFSLILNMRKEIPRELISENDLLDTTLLGELTKEVTKEIQEKIENANLQERILRES